MFGNICFANNNENTGCIVTNNHCFTDNDDATDIVLLMMLWILLMMLTILPMMLIVLSMILLIFTKDADSSIEDNNNDALVSNKS